MFSMRRIAPLPVVPILGFGMRQNLIDRLVIEPSPRQVGVDAALAIPLLEREPSRERAPDRGAGLPHLEVGGALTEHEIDDVARHAFLHELRNEGAVAFRPESVALLEPVA